MPQAAAQKRPPQQLDQNTIRAILSQAISYDPPNMKKAIKNFPDPLTDVEKTVLNSITPEELASLKEIELKLKDYHKSKKNVWGGAIW